MFDTMMMFGKRHRFVVGNEKLQDWTKAFESNGYLKRDYKVKIANSVNYYSKFYTDIHNVLRIDKVRNCTVKPTETDRNKHGRKLIGFKYIVPYQVAIDGSSAFYSDDIEVDVYIETAVYGFYDLKLYSPHPLWKNYNIDVSFPVIQHNILNICDLSNKVGNLCCNDILYRQIHKVVSFIKKEIDKFYSCELHKKKLLDLYRKYANTNSNKAIMRSSSIDVSVLYKSDNSYKPMFCSEHNSTVNNGKVLNAINNVKSRGNGKSQKTVDISKIEKALGISEVEHVDTDIF